MSVNSKMTAIADAIRGKTGKTEEMTLDQMATEIAGITGGGGDGLPYDMGEFVLDSDMKEMKHKNGSGIHHSLGEVPDFIVIWTDDFSDLNPDNLSEQSANVGYVWLNRITGLPQRATSAVTNEFSLYIPFCVDSGSYRLSAFIPTSYAYYLDSNTFPTNNAFYLPQQGAYDYWRTGVTYRYFVSKAWWNVGGAANVE